MKQTPHLAHGRWGYVFSLILITSVIVITPVSAHIPHATLPPRIEYGIIFGGSGNEEVIDLVTDAAGNTYLLGITTSPDFPSIRNGHPVATNPICGGHTCGGPFVVSFKSDGSAIRYSTPLGGDDNVFTAGLVVDSEGSVYIAGSTTIPLPGARAVSGDLSRKVQGGSDAFVLKLSPTGDVVGVGYFGGSEDDVAYGLARGPDGLIVVSGGTNSATFPVTTDLPSGAYENVFVTQISADLRQITFSSTFGGRVNDHSSGVVVGSDGTIYLNGTTESDDFPLRDETILPPTSMLMSDRRSFFASINPHDGTLSRSTYLGRSQAGVSGGQIVIAPNDDLLLAGKTYQIGSVYQLTDHGRRMVYQSNQGISPDIAFDAAGSVYVALLPWPNKSGFPYPPPGGKGPPCYWYSPNVAQLGHDGYSIVDDILAPYNLNAITFTPDGLLLLAGTVAATGTQRVALPVTRLGPGGDAEGDPDIYLLAQHVHPDQLDWQWPPPGYIANPGERRFSDLWVQSDQSLAASTSTGDHSWIWGPAPLTAEFCEQSFAHANKTISVQYFDKGRMEMKDTEILPNLYYSLTSRPVADMIEGHQSISPRDPTLPPADEAIAGDPADVNPTAPTYRDLRAIAALVNTTSVVPNTGMLVTSRVDAGGVLSNDPALSSYGMRLGSYDQESGHHIAQVFADFLDQPERLGVGRGSISGLALSEPFWVRTRVGGVLRDVLVQPFERRVLTYTPDQPAGWQVEFGNVGRHYLHWHYGVQP